jgi:phosphopantetheine--protein transferase-like protein
MATKSDVHIWYRKTIGLHSAAVELADQNLSIEERTRRDRLHFEVDRRDFTIAHDLLRRTLSQYSARSPAEWRFTTDEYGKPLIDGANPRLSSISFSLSHTRGYVACAIASGIPVGIDIELIDQSQPSQFVADKFFSQREASWLRQCPDELRSSRFVELWTLKEAFLKAAGIGFSGSLGSASSFCLDDNHIEFSASSNIEAREWHFVLFEPFHKVRLAVAVCSTRPRFVAQDYEANGNKLSPILKSK